MTIVYYGGTLNNKKSNFLKQEAHMLAGVSKAAKQLGVSAEHARRMIRAGSWPFYKLGARAVRVDVDEIRALGRRAPFVKDTAAKSK